MTILDHGPHSVMRKAYTGHYSQSNLSGFYNTIQDYVFEMIRVRIDIYLTILYTNIG